MHMCDRQTDGILIARPRLYCMQRGKSNDFAVLKADLCCPYTVLGVKIFTLISIFYNSFSVVCLIVHLDIVHCCVIVIDFHHALLHALLCIVRLLSIDICKTLL